MEWFRQNPDRHKYTMNAIYAEFGISKQGHWQALEREDAWTAKELCYVGLMKEVRQMHPGMGLRKMYEQFQPEGIGRDAFVALGLREGFRLHAASNPQRTTKSVKSARYRNLLQDKKFTNVNQLWVSDLFYFPLWERHYYVVLIMDVYSRRIIGYSVADSMRAEHNVKALSMALNLRGIDSYQHQLIHHSDRGSQYISDDYTNLLDDYNIQISMCTDVLENAHCERVNGTIKNEYLARWHIENFEQLQWRLPIAVNNYNDRRHDSLGMTPNEFETYVNELLPDQRPVMTVFTVNKSFENSTQLALNFDS